MKNFLGWLVMWSSNLGKSMLGWPRRAVPFVLFLLGCARYAMLWAVQARLCRLCCACRLSLPGCERCEKCTVQCIPNYLNWKPSYCTIPRLKLFIGSPDGLFFEINLYSLNRLNLLKDSSHGLSCFSCDRCLPVRGIQTLQICPADANSCLTERIYDDDGIPQGKSNL